MKPKYRANNNIELDWDTEGLSVSLMRFPDDQRLKASFQLLINFDWDAAGTLQSFSFESKPEPRGVHHESRAQQVKPFHSYG